jgi:hypothetical protein
MREAVCSKDQSGRKSCKYKKLEHRKKPHSIGTSFYRQNFYANLRGCKIFRIGNMPVNAARVVRRRKAGRRYTKMCGVTVIFFPL